MDVNPNISVNTSNLSNSQDYLVDNINISKTILDNTEQKAPAQTSKQSNLRKTFKQQFKEASQKDEVNTLELKQEERLKPTELKNKTQNKLNSLKDIITFNKTTKGTNPLIDKIAGLLDYSNIEKQKENKSKLEKELNQKLLIGKKQTIVQKAITGATNPLLAKLAKKFFNKKNNIEEITDEKVQDIASSLADKLSRTGKYAKKQITNQQKLFSLNFSTTLKFLRNSKSLTQRFTPECVIYDDETGNVDTEQTLECLGWEDIAPIHKELAQKLTIEALKKLDRNHNLIDTALDSGINLYNGSHPILNQKNKKIIAIEKLTGEVTIIRSIEDLSKMELHGTAYSLNLAQVAQ